MLNKEQFLQKLAELSKKAPARLGCLIGAVTLAASGIYGASVVQRYIEQFVTSKTQPAQSPSAACPGGEQLPSTKIISSIMTPYVRVYFGSSATLRPRGPFMENANPELQELSTDRFEEMEGWHLPDTISEGSYKLSWGRYTIIENHFPAHKILICRDNSDGEVYVLEFSTIEEMMDFAAQANPEPTNTPLPEPTDMGPLREGYADGDLLSRISALNLAIFGEQSTEDIYWTEQKPYDQSE